MLIPSIIETTGRSSRAFDLPTKLLQDRLVYFGGDVNDFSADVVIMQLLWLSSDNQENPIDLYIKSPGGSVYDGLAIKDVIDKLPCKVNTIGLGLCASMGAYLLACGTGTRKVTKNARIMIHSVSSGTGGTVHDQIIDLEETKFLQNLMMTQMQEYSKGKLSDEEIERAKRDYYLGAEDAKRLGLIDEII